MFHFTGQLDISKSWMNRALIIQSFDPEHIKINGSSNADDVLFLKEALLQFNSGLTILNAGLGGTTFRFLALRVSRKPGKYLIKAEPELLKRPQEELIHILKQLGVDVFFNAEGLNIHSNGWKKPHSDLIISTEQSSQFLSAVVLNSIHLDFDLKILLKGSFKSESYYRYTEQLLNQCGISFLENNKSIEIKTQNLNPQVLNGEIDVSSAFSLISSAVIAGSVRINNWNNQSQHPDMKFLNFFKLMNIPFEVTNNSFFIEAISDYKAIEADLSECPDLFPVLSVLCAFANGQSRLYGAPQLKFKESDRIMKTVDLLTRSGFEVEALDDGITISGNPQLLYLLKMEIIFNPENDHRMAMAATLLKLKGFPVRIIGPDCINKSYPQFYQHIGVNL